MAKVPLRTYNREIESMIDRGLLDEAIGHCHHILKTFPKHVETYRLLGKAYLEYKRYKDAVDIFSRVLVAEPNDFVANVGLSIIRDEENKLDDAIWHMERAFEVQPSNAAIQSELQRLYGRREGVQPPRIRMTRGALAHMYVQGELYPQAISEIKSVLKDDVGRSDMQVLLARAYYRSGQKTQAADEASGVLRRYPYCLDANRILVEILGVDRPENAQVYRQRVIELDPYAAQVAGSIFQSGEVGDAAVTIERLDWNGQPVSRESDWESTSAIRLEGETGRGTQTQPDWLKGGAFTDSTPPPQPKPTFVPTLPASTSASDFSASSTSAGQPAQPTPAEDIPDFLRAAGWGQSTGAFDESKPVFGSEPDPSSSAPIEQGELPDWVKAMAPPETMQPAQPTEEEDLPDWINKIGTGALPATSAASSSDLDWLSSGTDQSAAVSQPATDDQPDWTSQLDQPSLSQPAAEEQPDWMKGFDQPESAPPASDVQPDWMNQLDAASSIQPALDDQLDWLKGIGDEAESAPKPSGTELPNWMNQSDVPSSPQLAESQPAADDELDWLKGIGEEAEATPTTSATEQPDWMNQSDAPLASQLTESQPAADDELDWLKGIGEEAESTPTTSATEQPDWMKQLNTPSSSELTETQPVAEDEPDWLKGVGEEAEPTPATSETDQPDWMNQLDAPASAQLAESQSTVNPELDWLEGVGEEAEPTSTTSAVEQPDWLTQFGSQPVESEPVSTASAQNEFDFLNELTEQPQQPVSPASSVGDTANLGVSEQDRDDSFAWLENLAAKQGATEGLLTKPEDRLEQEPDWVTQARDAPQAPVQPPANLEDLGKSEQERDDSFAWLENLAAKQGATEGLLTKPEDRLEQEPDWVAQAKGATQAPVQPPANVEDLGKSEQERDDSFAWLENLAAKQGATEGLLTKPEDRLEHEPDWVAQAKSAPQAPVQPQANVEDLGKSEQERDDSFAWLENLAAKQGATEGLLTKPEDRLEQEPDWVAQAKSAPQTPAPPQANVEDLGKSEQERDDSFAWLENLAAKQGATEGLLTKPEDRLEQEPDWVAQAKSAPQAPVQPPANVEDLGKSEQERDDSFAWLENLAAKQGATEGLLTTPEERLEQEPDWVTQARSAPEPVIEEPVEEQPAAMDETTAWLRTLDEEESKPEAVSSKDETAMWFRKLEEAQPAVPVPEPADVDDMPAWLQGLEEEQTSITESVVPVSDIVTDTPVDKAADEFDWLDSIEEPVPSAESTPVVAEDETLPSWLKGMDEETRISESLPQDDLPAWMRDETGEVLAEPERIQPTRAADWQPVTEPEPEPELPTPQPVLAEEPGSQPPPEPIEVPASQPKSTPVRKAPPRQAEVKPATPPEPYREPVTRRGTGMLTMPIDPMLGSARSELSRSNIPGALEAYGKLIKKGRFLDEVIFDLREALYRYPVEVSIWQSLGDAYMRANRLQDALDAYTKAEELLR